jgi:hypothetical protein
VLYRTHCAACHGVALDGRGPVSRYLDRTVPALRDAGRYVDRPEARWLEVLATPDERTASMHGLGLDALDKHDLLAWLKQDLPAPGAFFPTATDYIAHVQTLDADGVQRVTEALGRPPDDTEKNVLVMAMFGPGEGASTTTTGAMLVPEDNAALVACKPIRRQGFVGYFPLKLDKGEVWVALALDRGMRLSAAQTLVGPPGDPSEGLRRNIDAIVRSYVGSGGRLEKKPVAPRAGKAPADVQKAMVRAYTLLLEGGAMYLKEERDRFWSDPDAFKFPEAADLPENVKFDFKQKR